MESLQERIRNRVHDAPMPTEHLLDEAADALDAKDAEIARVRAETLEEAARAVRSEALTEPQAGTSDEAYQQAIADAEDAVRALAKGEG